MQAYNIIHIQFGHLFQGGFLIDRQKISRFCEFVHNNLDRVMLPTSLGQIRHEIYYDMLSLPLWQFYSLQGTSELLVLYFNLLTR